MDLKNASKAVLDGLASTPSKATRYALDAVRVMGTRLGELKARGATNEHLTNARFAMLEAIRADLGDAVASEKAFLRGRLDKVKERYESDAKRRRADDAVKISTAERRFRAMLDDEVTSEAMRWLADETVERDPAVLDALSAELRSRGAVAEWETMRKSMVERNAYSPWEKEGLGSDLSADLRQLESASPGQVPLTIDGKRLVMDLSTIIETMEVPDAL